MYNNYYYMNDSKQILINTIKEWIEINTTISELQKKVKELKQKKTSLSNTLINVMESNDIDRFDINNGKLVHRKSKVKGQINKDYLSKVLDNYFKDFPEVDVLDVQNFILENRPVKINSSLIIRENKQ